MKNEITKRDALNAIKTMVEAFEDGFQYELENGKTVTDEDVLNYVENTIAQLDAKAQKIKENQANKREEDMLRDFVRGALTEEPQTINDIIANIPATYNDGKKDVEVTKAKVIARLTALAKNEVIIKEEVKLKEDAGTRKVMTYKLAPLEKNV